MSALFADDMVVVSLGSGSRGNCTFIGDGRTGVLIDCGISTKQVHTRLAEAGLAGARIDAVLITHEHSDHVAAAAVLERDLVKRHGHSVPFFATAGTARRIRESCKPADLRTIAAGVPFTHRGWTLEPHPVPHDTADPVAWAVEFGGQRAAVLTDLGHTPRSVAHLLSSLDIAVLEFNHDEQMLLEGSYPWQLKQRIRGRHGHLSNRQAARLLLAARPSRLRHLVLAHLSDENNTPERALETAHAALHSLGLASVSVQAAHQRHPTTPARVGARVWAMSAKRRKRTPRVPKVETHAQQSLFDLSAK